MFLNGYYSLLQDYSRLIVAVNLIAMLLTVYYGIKLYKSTRGASEFWLFLSAFIASLGIYMLLDFFRVTFLIRLDPVVLSAQDLAIAFAATFALICGVYAKKMFNELLGE
jgi:NO-binding membrane sensor protein with MHYT domain